MNVRLLVLSLMVFAAGAAAEEFQPGKAKVTATVLNVRNIASAGGSVVGSLKRGDVVEVVQRAGSDAEVDGVRSYWYRVTFQVADRKGKLKAASGWIFGAYITFELNVRHGLKFRSQRPSGAQSYRGVAVAPNGQVMVGGRSGSIYITANQGRSWSKIAPQALGNSIGTARKMLVSGREIWVAAEGKRGGGVWKTANSGESWAQYTIGQGLPSNEVRDITRASDGALWVATEKGIAFSRDEGRSWKRYGEGQPNMGKRVYALALGPGGRLWAGTDRGLTRSITMGEGGVGLSD